MTGQAYRIRIRSHLDIRWASWFENLSIQHEANGETLLTGSMPDQAALFGTLMKIRDLGLMLIAVEPVEQELKQEEG
jgi:hypothetical protein